MIVDLVRVTTADGVRLDGALQTPAKGAARPLPIDVVLLIHGTGSNFYSSSLLEAVARRLIELGTATLTVNTRGHDLLCTTATQEGPRRLGAAHEVVSDCGHDLAAWVTLLQQRGYRRIGLLGHSLGAIKCIYALAGEDPPNVACLIAVSPAHLSYDHFCDSPRGDEFRSTLGEAQRLVDDGRGETLMEVTFPLPYVVSADGYLEKYGPGERYNVLRQLEKMPCPTLVVFGSQEVQENIAFAKMPAAIETLAKANSRLKLATIAGGDHVYSGVRKELIARLETWLRKLQL